MVQVFPILPLDIEVFVGRIMLLRLKLRISRFFLLHIEYNLVQSLDLCIFRLLIAGRRIHIIRRVQIEGWWLLLRYVLREPD